MQLLILIHPTRKTMYTGTTKEFTSHAELAQKYNIYEDDYLHLCYSIPREFPPHNDILGIPHLTLSLNMLAMSENLESRLIDEELLNDLSNYDIERIERECVSFKNELTALPV